MPSHKWISWPQNTLKELNAAGGILGAAGVALGIAASPYLIFAGGVVLAGSVGYAAYKGFPDKVQSPQELIGMDLKLDLLKNVVPPLCRLGIVGASRSGKSTLIDHLRNTEARGVKTESVYAVVIPLQVNPIKYVALIDGAGNQYAQQFNVAENSDILVIFLDHDKLDNKKQITKKRIVEHEEFIDQMTYYLQGSGATPIKKAYFLLNKSDLWKLDQKHAELVEWAQNLSESWRNRGMASEVIFSEHSNRSPDMVTAFINAISNEI